MTDEQFYEMGEQFRDIKRLLLGREIPMITGEMKAKVNGLFDRIMAKYNGWLPFNGKYINALRNFVIANIDMVKGNVEGILMDQDFEKNVKALMMIAKGHLNVGFPWSLLANVALGSIEKWMLDKNNRDTLKEWIGSMPVN